MAQEQISINIDNSPNLLLLTKDTYLNKNILLSFTKGDSSTIVPISKGGTGATSAAEARTNLGLGNLATLSYNSDTTKYLRNDGSWVVPPDTKNLSNMTGTLSTDKGGTGNTSGYIRTGQKSGTTAGSCATTEGHSTTASGPYSHAEGDQTTATGFGGHAEGVLTVASGKASHAEGQNNNVSGASSHAEGYNHIVYGEAAHAEGNNHTINSETYNAHAEGYNNQNTANNTHTEGQGTKAKAECAHAQGYCTEATGDTSFAAGLYTTCANGGGAMSLGHYNVGMTTGGSSGNITGTAFVIGNGTSSTKANAFSVQFNGVVKAKGTITASTAADYAEFFEWADNNSNNEDRVGKFVTFDNLDKIRIANEDDNYILGVVSGAPFVVGNGDCDSWNRMYIRDDFNRIIYEPSPKIEKVTIKNEEDESILFEEQICHDENGEIEYEGERPKINPNYDNNETYISRFDRKEWDTIGMLGVLPVWDDGTCEINGYCKCADGGIATKADEYIPGKTYRVISRIKDNIIKVVFR